MDERALRAVAIVMAVVGIALLVFVRPEEEPRYRIRGLVVADAGLRSVVATNVTLVVRNASVGSVVDVAVFWNGDSFVAVADDG